jgi:hypothetical protein
LNGTKTEIPGNGVNLYRGVLVGDLVKKPDGTWSMDNGTVAGVVRPDQLLEAFEAMGFCENLCRTYATVKDYLNTYRDALTGTDEILKGTACDGLSFAEEFVARQATAGNIEIGDPPTDCPEPRHPQAPRQGCTCPVSGGGACVLDGGT